MMALTNEQEKQVSAGTTYADCFKGINLRRIEIACAVWIIQVWIGIWFGCNVTYFLEQAGSDPAKALDFSLGQNALAFCGIVTSWYLMPLFGKRTLYLVGLGSMLSILLAVGFMGIPHHSDGIAYASGSLLMLFVFNYDLTVGPICYCLVSEIPSTQLRVKTVVLARNANNVASIIANELNPPILNPTAWNLRGKGGFVGAGFCAASFVWSYFRLPEPKVLAPAEIDVLFEQKVAAHNFKKGKLILSARLTSLPYQRETSLRNTSPRRCECTAVRLNKICEVNLEGRSLLRSTANSVIKAVHTVDSDFRSMDACSNSQRRMITVMSRYSSTSLFSNSWSVVMLWIYQSDVILS